ncbi:hypothetical protein QUF75_14020 [Desulfococcaceae bacterium HSG7]|nr:hypothetical protein [Desulfococcaceae bacterium HSG7]
MESKHKFKPDPEYRLMDQGRVVLRYHHYAYKAEQAYCSLILRYIRFYGGKTHPESLDKTMTKFCADTNVADGILPTLRVMIMMQIRKLETSHLKLVTDKTCN